MGKRSTKSVDAPLAAPGPGFQLIEASAGTGKTYSITNQYILLLLGCRATGRRDPGRHLYRGRDGGVARPDPVPHPCPSTMHSRREPTELIDDERLRQFLEGIAADE